MPSNHLILCHPILLLPSLFPSIRVFSSQSALHSRWPKYLGFSFSISPSSDYSGLISSRIDWLDLLAVQETLKSLLQHDTWKASTLQSICVFHPPLLQSLGLPDMDVSSFLRQQAQSYFTLEGRQRGDVTLQVSVLELELVVPHRKPHPEGRSTVFPRIHWAVTSPPVCSITSQTMRRRRRQPCGTQTGLVSTEWPSHARCHPCNWPARSRPQVCP